MSDVEQRVPGRREKKREETLQRIARVGLQLFLAQGYEATTLEQIAAAAGISRRTFFYYLKSKEEVLLAWEGHRFADAVKPAMLAESPDQAPFALVRRCLVDLVARYETPQSIDVDRLLRSTEALRTRKMSLFTRIEDAVFDALCALWPESDRLAGHRLLAMASAGAVRLAIEDWRAAGGKTPMADHLRKTFADLMREAPTWGRTEQA